MTDPNHYDMIGFNEEKSLDTTFSSVDYDYSCFPPISPLFGGLFDDSAITPKNFTSPSSINLSSSPQLFADGEDQLLAEVEYAITPNSHEFSQPILDSHENLFGTSQPQVNTNKYEVQTLEIIAQPTPTYRPRYESELNRDKGRANRFIHAANGNPLSDYPTIKIPLWCQPNQQLYVRVTLVTVCNDSIRKHCIHPYRISTSDENTINDPANNSIYFRLNENEYRTRVKRFRIMILKKKQDHLQKVGPMRLFDLEQCDNISPENPSDPRQKIQLYQLEQSQFVFTLAERQGDSEKFSLYLDTSVESNPMTEKADAISNSPRNHLQRTIIDGYLCVPQKSIWNGGEKVVIIMSKPIKKLEEYSISFDFGQKGIPTIVEMELINTTTVLIQTPACPFPATDEDLAVPILVHKNQSLLFFIDFYYTPSIQTMMRKRAFDQGEDTRIQLKNKIFRAGTVEEVDCIVPQMDRLSLKTDDKPRSHSTSVLTDSIKEKLKGLDQRLRQIKLGMEDFVRTSDPSTLFRAAGFLLSRHNGDSSPLHDAIRNGHTQIALTVIEQTIDLPLSKNLLVKVNENAETPLLVAAKLNQWKIIETILKARPKFAKQADKDGNNLLHLLAKLSNDQSAKTVEKILAILSEELKMHLLKEENQQNQTPMDIARSHNNTSCLKLSTVNENHSK